MKKASCYIADNHQCAFEAGRVADIHIDSALTWSILCGYIYADLLPIIRKLAMSENILDDIPYTCRILMGDME